MAARGRTMNMKLHLTTPVLVLAILFLAAVAVAPAAWAQAEQTPENLLDEPLEPQAEEAPEADAEREADGEAENGVASRETDFSEENFRRSMELRDRALQRSPDLTTGSYSTGTGLRALDELPESSQKHLREELREVIVRNGPWTPEAAGEVYPYTPSDGAKENRSLQKRERSAWGELVAEYHEREAAIHANAARSQAATSPIPNSKGQAGSQGREREHAAAQAGNSAQQATVPQGVSQNALELLTNRRQLPAGAAAGQGQPQAQPAQSPPTEASAAQQRQAASAQNVPEGQQASQKPDVDLAGEDVIAIDDLQNIDLGTDRSRDESGEDPD